MTSLNLLVGLALVSSAVGQMNFEMGSRMLNDEYYCSDSAVKSKNWINIVVDFVYVCEVPDSYMINKVKVTNYVSDRAVANVTDISGGPGFKKVTLKFTSKWLYGINSFVEVWAINKTLIPSGFVVSSLFGNTRPPIE